MTSDIYTGTWINWTSGRVVGATLTISSQHGSLLVAFLALFVRFSGSHFWDICRYAIFQYRCRLGPKDVYQQQQQVLLRNSTADTSMVWNLARTTWAWRKKTKRPFLRSISLLTWATVQIIAFSAAGIFSSQVASTQPEVLLQGSNCGTWSSRLNYLSPTFNPSTSEWISDIADAHNAFITSSRFTASCYNQSTTSLEGCLPYGRRKLTWSNDTAACPFDESMCIDNAAVTFDTGYLDTHLDFGINTASEDRVQFRGISTCAPITTKGFVSDWLNTTQADLPAYSDPTPDELFLEFYYGRNPVQNVTPTFFFSNSSFIYAGDDSVTPNMYLLGPKLAFGQPNYKIAGDFVPIPQLHRPDAVVVLYFLARSSAYLEPVYDPWFLAQEPYLVESDNTTFYFSQDPVAVMGCTYESEICNANAPNGRTCFNPFIEGSDLDEQLGGVGFNTRQSSIARRILTSSMIGSAYSLILAQGASDLIANRHSIDGVATSLPPDQWVLEANHMFGTALNNLQILSVEYVTGPSDLSDGGNIVDLPDEDQWMCTSQIVRRDDYTSFNVLGLAIILAVGGCFILLNLTLIPMVSRIQESTEPGQHRNEEWQASDMLQLHRVALENQGIDRWEDADNSVPITTYSDTIPLPLRQISDSYKASLVNTIPASFALESDRIGRPLRSPSWKLPIDTFEDLESNSFLGSEHASLMLPAGS